MKGRFWAVLLLFAAPASAMDVAPVQAPDASGVTGPTIVVPMKTGGVRSLQDLLGPVKIQGDISKFLSVPKIGDKDNPQPRPFAPARMSLPGLPTSAVPGAPEQAESAGPEAETAFETAAEPVANGAWQRNPGSSLEPGPGGKLPSLQRQALRLATKTSAVQDQLRAAEVETVTAEEGAQGLGRRLMDILTEERNVSGRGVLSAPAADRPAGWAFATGAGRLSAPGLAVAVRDLRTEPMESESGWVPPLRPASYAPADTRPQGQVLSADAQRSRPADLALIALTVSRQSLILSEVDAPARRLASRWAADSALALAQADGQAYAQVAGSAADSELRDALASPAAAQPAMIVLLGGQVQVAQSEAFSFIQTAALASAAQDASSGRAAPGPKKGEPDQTDPAPRSWPDPTLGVALLPFLGLLILRSRLFS